jgi:predicted nucleic acid-binding protein
VRAVSDTSPLSYLVLIDQTDLLPQVFTAVSIPEEVRAELASSRAPSPIQEWIGQPPPWLVIDSTPLPADPVLDRLHAGERAAILLAERLGGDIVLLDEKAARAVGVGRGLHVSGVLGVLREAASRGLVDLPTAVEALLSAGFRASPALLKSLFDTR